MVARTDRGPIGPLTLPFLIQDLCGRRMTGTLVLRDEEVHKTLYLDSGRPEREVRRKAQIGTMVTLGMACVTRALLKRNPRGISESRGM